MLTFCPLEKEKAQIELEALKKQAEGVSTEYDRLLGEHSKLQVSETVRLQSCRSMAVSRASCCAGESERFRRRQWRGQEGSID